MKVDVTLYASLSRYAPPGGVIDGLGDGTTVREVVERLGVPEAELKLVFVNGLHVELDRSLNPGDRLGLFPAVGGG